MLLRMHMRMRMCLLAKASTARSALFQLATHYNGAPLTRSISTVTTTASLPFESVHVPCRSNGNITVE
jgi:hypothetical protein